MKLMVFLHGTVIMHSNAVNRSREERVTQVLESDPSVHDYESYVPVGNAVTKLHAWRQQGAEIVYLSSHTVASDVESDRIVLRRHGFPEGPVLFRDSGEPYHAIAEREFPDILIEDDCESIGGEQEMTYPQIDPKVKVRVKSIVVQEFGGIDELPDSLSELAIH